MSDESSSSFRIVSAGMLGGKLGADCVTRCIEASGSYHKRAGILSPSFCIAYEPFKALILKGDNGQQVQKSLRTESGIPNILIVIRVAPIAQTW